MSKQQNSIGGRNCWKAARERDRMKARFDIRKRVATLGEEVADKSPKNALDDEQEADEINQAKIFLRQVEAGAVSAFSLSKLSKHIGILDKPVSTKLLSEYKISTLCTSRFGKEYTNRALAFFRERETCTIMEYASLLGEYKILGSLMIGGVDPTHTGWTSLHQQTHDERISNLSIRVLQRFFNNFPLSLKTYIAKRVVDMRVEACFVCQQSKECMLCNQNHHSLLSFGSPCHHSYCEACFWDDLLNHVDNRDEADVILCPCCGISGDSSHASSPFQRDTPGLTPMERYQKSIAKYKCLPANTQELKSRPKEKVYRKDAITSNWQCAVIRSLGSSQDVRRDKFFNFVEHNSFHFVRGCLEEGVDANLVNEYSQTGLYLASWKGYQTMVLLLLAYGADISIAAHGGSTAIDAASWNGHYEIVSILSGSPYAIRENAQSLNGLTSLNKVHLTKPVATMLIDPHSEHPGAGSYIIDDSIAAQDIENLIALLQVTPAACHGKQKPEKCSERHYFCDVEGSIRRSISNAIHQAGVSEIALVFPNMRFLNYSQQGILLAPHVDLCRLDNETGVRSTHTFILYLYDCSIGGETALLDSLSGTVVLAMVAPRRGRLLLFPHNCPHEGLKVVDVPKVLLRGEVCIAK